MMFLVRHVTVSERYGALIASLETTADPDERTHAAAEWLRHQEQWLRKQGKDFAPDTVAEVVVHALLMAQGKVPPPSLTRDDKPCHVCQGWRFLPNWMNAPGHPRCACGRDSVDEAGTCGLGHPPVPCPRCGGAAEVDPPAESVLRQAARWFDEEYRVRATWMGQLRGEAAIQAVGYRAGLAEAAAVLREMASRAGDGRDGEPQHGKALP